MTYLHRSFKGDFMINPTSAAPSKPCSVSSLPELTIAERYKVNCLRCGSFADISTQLLTMLNIRSVTPQDTDTLKTIIDANELFPGDLLDDMLTDFFTNPSTQDIWLTGEADKVPVAVAYCAPERMTEGTYNLYLIAVHPDHQGQGVGSAMMKYVEDLLRSREARILLVETSGLPEFELTRTFYDRCHYQREAVIRDFYREGEDKVVFRKKLINY